MRVAYVVNSVLTIVAALLLYSHYAMGPTIFGNVLVLLLSGFLCVCNIVLSLIVLAKAGMKLLPLGNLVIAAFIFAFIFYLFSTNRVPAGYGP